MPFWKKRMGEPLYGCGRLRKAVLARDVCSAEKEIACNNTTTCVLAYTKRERLRGREFLIQL
jgi:hypothetical protein